MQITGLNVHPVKSTAQRPVGTARVLRAGLESDREWVVVDGDGVMVSARELPSLFSVTADTPATAAGLEVPLRLRAPGQEDLLLGLPSGDPEPFHLFRNELTGVRVGPVADDWLRAATGRDDLRLLWCHDPAARAVKTPPGAPGDSMRFPDAYPVTIGSEASLRQLQAWVDEVAAGRGEAPVPLTMRRFRPNIVVDGDEPFAEDGWVRLTIGDVRLRVVKPVARCVMTTIDPHTLSRGHEPVRTLARHRLDGSKTLFCVHAVVESEGAVAVGDELIATSRH